MDESLITFRTLEKQDLNLLHRWLNEPHVYRWWGHDGTSHTDIEERYMSIAERKDLTKGFIILYNAQSVGFIQTYKLNDYPEWEDQLRMKDNVAGIDLFIGEKNLIGHGLGTKVIRKFVHEIVFTIQNVTGCIADPAVENPASVKAFKNAGFTYFKNSFDPETGDKEVVLRLDKPLP